MKNYDMMSDEIYSVVVLLVFLGGFATCFLSAGFVFSFRIWIYFLRFISNRFSLNLIGSFRKSLIPRRMIPYNGGPLPKKPLGLGGWRSLAFFGGFGWFRGRREETAGDVASA